MCFKDTYDEDYALSRHRSLSPKPAARRSSKSSSSVPFPSFFKDTYDKEYALSKKGSRDNHGSKHKRHHGHSSHREDILSDDDYSTSDSDFEHGGDRRRRTSIPVPVPNQYYGPAIVHNPNPIEQRRYSHPPPAAMPPQFSTTTARPRVLVGPQPILPSLPPGHMQSPPRVQHQGMIAAQQPPPPPPVVAPGEPVVVPRYAGGWMRRFQHP